MKVIHLALLAIAIDQIWSIHPLLTMWGGAVLLLYVMGGYDQNKTQSKNK